MTNTLLLEMMIRRAGLTKKVARHPGLSSMGLHKKMNNQTEFKASETAQLYNLLNLSSLEEQQQIFLLMAFTYSKQRKRQKNENQRRSSCQNAFHRPREGRFSQSRKIVVDD